MSGETVALDGGGLAGGAAPWGFEPVVAAARHADGNVERRWSLTASR